MSADKLIIDHSTKPPTLTVISETRISLSKLQDLRDAENRVKARGSHYFDEDTKRYFKALFHAQLACNDGSLIIVESTKRTGFREADGAREYRVMRVSLTGEISHFKAPGSLAVVGDSFSTKARALKDALAKRAEFEATGKIAGER